MTSENMFINSTNFPETKHKSVVNGGRPIKKGPLSWVSQGDLMQINFFQTLKRITGMGACYQLNSMLNKRLWTKKITNKQTNEKNRNHRTQNTGPRGRQTDNPPATGHTGDRRNDNPRLSQWREGGQYADPWPQWQTHYRPLPPWLTFGHASLNYRNFLAFIGSAVSVHLQTNRWWVKLRFSEQAHWGQYIIDFEVYHVRDIAAMMSERLSWATVPTIFHNHSRTVFY